MFAEMNFQSGSNNNAQMLTSCPFCHANYNPLKTQIMAERDDAHLLFLECRQCSSAVMAVVTNGLTGLSSVGAVTDLTSQEVSEVQSRGPVSDDDVIATYDLLENDRHFLDALRHYH